MKLFSFKEFFSEAVKDSVVFTFGRMNPPTVGHGKLIDKVLSVAKTSELKQLSIHLKQRMIIRIHYLLR